MKRVITSVLFFGILFSASFPSYSKTKLELAKEAIGRDDYQKAQKICNELYELVTNTLDKYTDEWRNWNECDQSLKPLSDAHRKEESEKELISYLKNNKIDEGYKVCKDASYLKELESCKKLTALYFQKYGTDIMQYYLPSKTKSKEITLKGESKYYGTITFTAEYSPTTKGIKAEYTRTSDKQKKDIRIEVLNKDYFEILNELPFWFNAGVRGNSFIDEKNVQAKMKIPKLFFFTEDFSSTDCIRVRHVDNVYGVAHEIYCKNYGLVQRIEQGPNREIIKLTLISN